MSRSIVVDGLPGLDGHTAVMMGDSLVVYGGKTGRSSLNPNVFCLNLTTNRWQRLACGGITPAPRTMHSAVVYGWRMIVFGGILAIGIDDIHYNTFNVFAHPDSLDEAVLREKGKNRMYHPDKLRRVTQQKRESSSLYALTMQEEPNWAPISTFGSVPPTRAGHSCCIHRSTMYVFGGYSVHTTGRPTDEEVKAVYLVYGLNLDTLTWAAVDCFGSVPPMRWGAASILSASVWLQFGGVDVTTCEETNTVAAWHFDQGEWRWVTTASEGPPARSMHTAVRWGSTMLVFGGASGVSSVLFNDLYAFDLLDGTWTHVATRGTAPIPRYGHTMTLVGDRIYIFGGVDHAFDRNQRVWALDLNSWEWNTVSCSFSSHDLSNVRGIGPQNLAEGEGGMTSPGGRRHNFEAYGDIVAQPGTSSSPHITQSVQTLPLLDRSGARVIESGSGPSPGEAYGASTRLRQAQFDELPVEFMSVEGPSPSRGRPGTTFPVGGLGDTAASLVDPSPMQEDPGLDPAAPEQRTHTYPVAWSAEHEQLHTLRHGIAQSKSVLNNMLDAAAARADREAGTTGASASPQKLREDYGTKGETRAERQADEARANIDREVSSRTQRLRDLSQTVGSGTYTAAQKYWEDELKSLSQEHDLFRQATQRGNVMDDVYDRLHNPDNRPEHSSTAEILMGGGSPAGSPNRRLKLTTTGPTPKTQHDAMTHETTASLFPGSASMQSSGPGGAPNRIHDPDHPQYQPIKFSAPKRHAYVSPSIAKLGLSNQLGRTRTTKGGPPTQPAFDLAIPTPATGGSYHPAGGGGSGLSAVGGVGGWDSSSSQQQQGGGGATPRTTVSQQPYYSSPNPTDPRAQQYTGY